MYSRAKKFFKKVRSTGSRQSDIMSGNEAGKFIHLASRLKPTTKSKSEDLKKKSGQNTLFEKWTRNIEIAKEKTFVLGSEVDQISNSDEKI